MEGLLGLTKSINDRETAVRDLSVLERMESRVQKDREAEVNAQKEQQLFYESMYAKADTLLEKDRKNVNKEIYKSQQQVKKHLMGTGGSEKDFLQQGGVNILNEMKNGIIRSDAVVMYEENKKNLAKILEAQEKGMGHLLSPSDLETLENYQKNKNGNRITYSGLMTEVEIPPSQNFDYGTEIPIESIISYNGNMMKILGNYKTVYPDRPKPTPGEIAAFVKKMGYGGQGSNTMRLRQAAANERSRKQYNSKTSTKTKNEKKSWLANWGFAASKIPKVKVSDLMEGGAYEDGLIETIRKNNPSSMYNQLLKNKSGLYSKDRKNSSPNDVKGWNPASYISEGIGEAVDQLFNGSVGLKESYEFMPTSSAAISKRIITDQMGYEIKEGAISNFIPDEKLFRADGVKMTGENKPNDFNDYKGSYKIKGVVSALKSRAGDGGEGEDILLVNYYDDDGNIDKKSTNASDEALSGNRGGSENELTTVIALENENGDLFYKEVDLKDTDVQVAVSNAIGDDDDITENVTIQQRQQKAFQNLEAITTEQQIQFKTAIKKVEDTFQDEIFIEEGTKYWGANSGGQLNRNDMMKSFYMAFDHTNNSYKRTNEHPQGDRNIYPSNMKRYFDNDFFTNAAISGNIEEELKDYSQGNNPEEIIMKWFENTIDSEEYEEGSLEYKRNAELAQKWIQMLNMM